MENNSPPEARPAAPGASHLPASTPHPIFAAAKAARAAYEDAIDSDGVTARAWQSIADDLHATATAMADMLQRGAVPPGYFLTPGQILCHRDRARDAEHRAQFAARMVEIARRSPRMIDMETHRQRIPVVRGGAS